MKRRFFALLLVLLALCLCFVSCSESSGDTARTKPTKGMINLSALQPAEQYAKSMEITQNFDSYVGKTVKLKGTYQQQNYNFIIIYDGTCCSNYFEFLYNGTLPNPGDQIELTGTFDYYSDSAGSYPYINVTQLTKI